MEEKLYRKIESRYCLLAHRQVTATRVMQSNPLGDGSTEEVQIALECPRSEKCRKQGIGCLAVCPDTGKDPFTVGGNLLADLW